MRCRSGNGWCFRDDRTVAEVLQGMSLLWYRGGDEGLRMRPHACLFHVTLRLQMPILQLTPPPAQVWVLPPPPPALASQARAPKLSNVYREVVPFERQNHMLPECG